MKKKEAGSLIIIGGGEDKKGERAILAEVAGKAAGRGKLVIVTAATEIPDEYLQDYLPVFKELGVRDVDVLDIRSRADAYAEDGLQKLREAAVVFFTGGRQLRIASQVGGSPIYKCMRQAYESGATIAGTSAGAAVMPETMVISGPSDDSPDPDALAMAPGLGLLQGVVVDSHFAQRGRIGRLLAAVAQNPRNLGLGIDEDTAIVVDGHQDFRVIGSGAIYVVDGGGISYSSLERSAGGVLTVHDVKLHVLAGGDAFDWASKRPRLPNDG